MRIVLAGAVTSTQATLNQLIKHKMDLVGVLGYEPKSLKNVSAYTLLKPIAEEESIPYKGFFNINDPDVVDQIKEWKPDLLFVVGLSQLVKDEIMNIPTKGVVGFHPTNLPRGRGRAPIAWSILNEKKGGANFFLIDSGVDSGPILGQKLFDIEEDDYAEDFELKMLDAISEALEEWFPKLKNGKIEYIEQEHSKATYYGRRAPNDGCINWSQTSKDIYKLIRASSRPHPGAFTFKEDVKIIIWKARIENNSNFAGVIGRVLEVDEDGVALVQTGEGLLSLIDYEIFDLSNNRLNKKLKVGQKLGYYSDIEIFKMKQELEKLKKY
ncbi:formyl transferase [Tenacibaculum singaporense]|uniref:Formyl transferase n=1 Tax=Tenacibaculum singaporense TaxID=2358479 RepID=A0A3S8R5L2_9FLAO|nr:formyltransferase family protein [Tenacibaculum singaporense]AZJ35043.1 formyl transferase [Tenacibaculum singaporense]